MREDFLHFIWRQARFDLRDLLTTTGATLGIQHFGTHNHDAGPDFSSSRISIDGVSWAGNVEIHVNASEWYEHGHETDPQYDNVILHVVYEEDRPVYRSDGQRIPCLELFGRIPPGIYQAYYRLQRSEQWILCQQQVDTVPGSIIEQWLEELLTERLGEKSLRVTDCLERTGNDWEDTFYQFLARALGGRVNSDAMETLARSLPLRTLLKHKHSLLQIEALLFGQASLLPDADEDEYVKLLRREYEILRIKYRLRPIPKTAWRYLRLRPNSFPTVRIAQLATMIFRTGQLFGKSLAATSVKELTNMYDVELSNYWRTHYRFGKEGSTGKRRLGSTTIHSILINTVAPALVAYGNHRTDERFIQRARLLLAELPSESNKIIRKWAQTGIASDSAGSSQALLHLKHSYCDRKRCTECRIGSQLLSSQYAGHNHSPDMLMEAALLMYGAPPSSPQT